MGNYLKSTEGDLHPFTSPTRGGTEGRVTISWELLVSAWLGRRGKGDYQAEAVQLFRQQ